MHYDVTRGTLAVTCAGLSFINRPDVMGDGVPEFVQIVTSLFSRISPRALAIITAIARAGGRPLSASEVARRIGVPDRHHITRILKRDGLPSFEELAAWLSVTAWLHAAEREEKSLFRIATEMQREPATCYRMVKRVTGMSWQAAYRRGFGWQLGRLVERCDRRVANPEILKDWRTA